jgi:hypothetical protein
MSQSLHSRTVGRLGSQFLGGLPPSRVSVCLARYPEVGDPDG